MDTPRYIDINGVQTRYFAHGYGEPMVLVHGGDYVCIGTACDWDLNYSWLANHFHVHALDALGQGFTGFPAYGSAFTVGPVIDHLEAFLETLGLRNVVLVGHSRGALATTRIALDRPELVRALVIIDSNSLGPEHPSTPMDFYEVALASKDKIPTLDELRREPEMNSYSTHHVGGCFLDARYKASQMPEAQDIISRARLTYEEEFVPSATALRSRLLRRIEGGELRVPTLVIWGQDDPSAPVVIGHNLFSMVCRSVEQAVMHIFNCAGHYPHREHSAATSRLITSFVKGEQ